MPTCRDVSELVTDYLERRLPWSGWLGVRWHLLGCDACRRYVAQMRQLVRLLADNALSPPSQETEDSLLRAAHDGRASPAPGE